MATTYTLQIPTTEDYDLKVVRIPLAGHANFKLKQNGVDTENLQEANFVYSAGAGADVFTGTARRSYNAKLDQTNCSIRIGALIKKSVSETGEVDYLPIEGGVFWNHPGRINPDSSMAVKMVSLAVAVCFQELTGANGTPTTKIVDQFDHSIVTGIFG